MIASNHEVFQSLKHAYEHNNPHPVKPVRVVVVVECNIIMNKERPMIKQ